MLKIDNKWTFVGFSYTPGSGLHSTATTCALQSGGLGFCTGVTENPIKAWKSWKKKIKPKITETVVAWLFPFSGGFS